ncbi:hypothetical protein ES703_98738 [subsurface metagenome]
MLKPLFLSENIQEMVGKEGNIFFYFSQGRHMDLDNIQPVVKVFSKSFFGDFMGNVSICG